jgi:hypothetical protein
MYIARLFFLKLIQKIL